MNPIDLIPLFLIGQIIDLASLAGALIEIGRAGRDQLADMITTVMDGILWTLDKGFNIMGAIIHEFPYDNYNRAIVLGLLATFLVVSLLVLFGVAEYAQPTFLGGTGFMPTHNPNAKTNADDLTISIGSNALRDRVGEAGTGIAINDGVGTPSSGGGEGGGGQGGGTTTTTIGGTRYATLCGNGNCESQYVTAAKQIVTSLGTDDNILYYDIPVWCLKDDQTPQYYTIGQQIYYGIVGTTNLHDSLNQYCNLSTYTHELIYTETIMNCVQDCLQQNRTNMTMPEYCYNLHKDADKGEEGIDCGGLCIPCTCHNATQDGDETGVDCGGSCLPCYCNPTGVNFACSLGYCCDTGDCKNHCVTYEMVRAGLCDDPFDIGGGCITIAEDVCSGVQLPASGGCNK